MLSTFDQVPVTSTNTLSPTVKDIAKRKRLLGAYFTPDALTKVICDWAIKSSTEKILEPSFGGCGFLEAAVQRLDTLGAQVPARNLYG